MTTIKSALRSLVRLPLPEPVQAKVPANISGQESDVVWDDNMGGGESMPTITPGGLSSPLTEIQGHREYYDNRALQGITYNDGGVEKELILSEHITIASILAEDASGQIVRVKFANPYAHF